MVRKLQVAVSGLGRMGARHARHFLEKTPRAELVAACDPDPNARAWAAQHLAPYGTKIYEDFDEIDRKSTRLNSSHSGESRMPSSA